MKFGRELYSVFESYGITYKGARHLRDTARMKKSRVLNSEFVERIMLAVTEVNSCELCSYVHTKVALESGMNNEEIKGILSGVLDDIPGDELPAIMFAQHYADSRGKPTQEAWERIAQLYGNDKAKNILGVVRVIMIGNVYGIPMGSLYNRFKGKADLRSNIFYEITMLVSSLIVVPFALLHGLFANVCNVPFVKY